MDNSAEFSRMLASRYQSNVANNNLVRNDPSQQAAAVAINGGFVAATAPSASRAENTSSTGPTNHPVQRQMAAQSHNSMINNMNNNNIDNSIGMNPSTGASSGYSNNNINNNNGSEASTTLSNYNSTLTSSSGGGPPMPPPGGNQFFQPPNQQPTMQNTVGLIDPQTRLLLETILRLDDQMRGIVTNSSSSNNDTSLSSTSSDQQQQQLQQQQQQLLASSQETTTESTTNSTSGTTDPKSTGDDNVAKAPGTANLQMMFQESSSNSSSSEEETMQVPCRARGQPPEHNYLTAYFTIKKNEKHGRELVCSFPGCRDGGVKFCYCAYCRTPVARRNFRLRHHHANAKLPVKSKNKATKKKAKSLSKHQSKDNVASAVLPTRDRTNVGTNNNAAAAASMAQAGVMAAAAAAAGAGGNANAVTNLLLESFAQALRQGQIGGGSPTVGEESMANAKEEQGGRGSIGIGQQQHAIANAPTAMEEISRLGDSSASTSTSDGSAVRIPCRARGMPLDHTIESAYFTISKNVKHGDELICSHQECAASGIKFCWCSFCKLPVAKRNFRIRHHHCDLVKPPNMIAGKSVGNGDADKSKKRKAKQQDVPSTSEDSDLTTQSPGADDQEPARVNDDGNNTATSSTGTKKKRKKAWSKLLDKFPTGGNDENKKDWLAKVLLVSDKKTRRGQLRPDIQPHEETKDMAAIYLEKSKKPRKRHRKASV